jgi:hypothetical protein
LTKLPHTAHQNDEIIKLTIWSAANTRLIENARIVTSIPALSTFHVPPDGNCLFNSVNAAQYLLNPNNPSKTLKHEDLRSLTCYLAKLYITNHEEYDQGLKDSFMKDIDRAVMDGCDFFNEHILIAIASIRNGDILIIEESVNSNRYAPLHEMLEHLAQPAETPKTETIILLHRTSAAQHGAVAHGHAGRGTCAQHPGGAPPGTRGALRNQVAQRAHSQGPIAGRLGPGGQATTSSFTKQSRKLK